MTNNIPYLRKDTLSTILPLSAAAIALLLTSSLLFSQALQPVQAQQSLPTSIQTRDPVALGDNCNVANTQITFDAQGNGKTFTSGTFQITNINNSSQILWSGDIDSVDSGPDNDGSYGLVYNIDNNGIVCNAPGTQLTLDVNCGDGTSDNPNITLATYTEIIGSVGGVVDCDTGGDTTTTAQPSSPMIGTTTTTTTQDSDGDGIPDSSDRCTHNSNPRCFKEGDTTTQQQLSSAINRMGG